MCGAAEETPRHVILECPFYEVMRHKLEVELQRSNVSVTLENILGVVEHIPAGEQKTLLKVTGRFLCRIRQRRRI
jgi:hypothetical protein